MRSTDQAFTHRTAAGRRAMEKEHRSKISLLGNRGRSEGYFAKPEKNFPLLLARPPLSPLNLAFSEEGAMGMDYREKREGKQGGEFFSWRDLVRRVYGVL
jgi:hypothetical protein